jgi:hypothetical protein
MPETPKMAHMSSCVVKNSEEMKRDKEMSEQAFIKNVNQRILAINSHDQRHRSISQNKRPCSQTLEAHSENISYGLFSTREDLTPKQISHTLLQEADLTNLNHQKLDDQ